MVAAADDVAAGAQFLTFQSPSPVLPAPLDRVSSLSFLVEIKWGKSYFS